MAQNHDHDHHHHHDHEHSELSETQLRVRALETILTEIGAKNTRARYAGRKASASPATGLASRHKFEQETLVKEALG